MNFLAPAAFALGLLLPIVIAMYLLKLRRTEQIVPSVYLWRRMVRDVEANAPWQRLRRNLLLLLQLLFLAVLILALTRPYTWAEGAAAQTTILILDASASMAATDLSPNRLEAAKNRARQLVESLPDSARATVISAGARARVLVSSSQDLRLIHNAIDSIEVEPSSSDMATAIQLASAIAARQADAEIIILSDGRVDIPERLTLNARLRYLPFGLSDDNQAISLLTVTPSPGGVYLTAFAQVTNYSSQSAHRRLDFYADGQLVGAYNIEIPPEDQIAILAEDLPGETRQVEARLSRPGCTQPCPGDVLLLDDQAWAVVRPAEPASILLVSEGNFFVETAFSLLPAVDLTTVKPNEYLASVASEQAPALSDQRTYNLIIFDRFIPGSFIETPDGESSLPGQTSVPRGDLYQYPQGNLLFIAPPDSTPFFSVRGFVDEPVLRPVEADDPLLAHVNLAEVSVIRAVAITLPEWARPIVAGDLAGDSTPLFFAGEVNERRVVVLAFDLHHSDLPLQVAFPLLVANLSNWLAGSQGGSSPEIISPAAPISLSLPIKVDEATVVHPDGSRARIAVRQGQLVFSDTNQLGVYRVRWGDGEQTGFAVNLFSPQESNVRPADNLPLTGIQQTPGSAPTQAARQEWWRLLGYLALGVLVAEWLVYHRASLARLRAKLAALLPSKGIQRSV